MRETSIMFAVMVLMLAASAASAANEVYLDPQTVYIPECGNATVQVRLNATDTIDTWSTKIGFDDTCVNVTDVDFAGGITPTNASWGHHVDYIYLGGTELTAVTPGDYLLANLTVECNGSCGHVNLNLRGDEDIERLVAGLPDTAPPRNGTIHFATWTNGSAQCVVCGNVNVGVDNNVDFADVMDLLYYVGYPGQYTICSPWAADVNCGDPPGTVDFADVMDLLYYVGYPGQYELHCCK